MIGGPSPPEQTVVQAPPSPASQSSVPDPRFAKEPKGLLLNSVIASEDAYALFYRDGRMEAFRNQAFEAFLVFWAVLSSKKRQKRAIKFAGLLLSYSILGYLLTDPSDEYFNESIS